MTMPHHGEVAQRRRQLVRTRRLEGAGSLPVIEPSASGAHRLESLTAWLEDQRSQIDRLLAEEGAVLLRGFGVTGAGELAAVAAALGPVVEKGPTARRLIAPEIDNRPFDATDYPAGLKLEPANELTLAGHWPRRILHYCLIPPGSGGESLITDGRKVLKAMPGALAEHLTRHGLRYVRRLSDVAGSGESWMTAFGTADRAAVEAYCRRRQLATFWQSGRLTFSQFRRAVDSHPETGESVWLNASGTWHIEKLARLLGPSQPADAIRPLEVTLGNGAALGPADIAALRSAIERSEQVVKLQQADILILDNWLTAHGRRPFKGTRKLLSRIA